MTNHRISSTAPPVEQAAVIAVARPANGKHFRLADIPVHDTIWDGSISLRRDDMYGDDERWLGPSLSE